MILRLVLVVFFLAALAVVTVDLRRLRGGRRSGSTAGSRRRVRMPRWRLLASLALGVAALVAVLVVLGGNGDGRQAAPLPSRSLHGPKVTTASLRGRPYLVNFWASWCPPCREEAPELARFARRGQGIRLIGVDTDDDAMDALAFIRRYHWDFPVFHDAGERTAAAWGLPGLPSTFVVDRHGLIVATLEGPQTMASLYAAWASVPG